MSDVVVRGLTAGYGGADVLDHLDLEVPSGSLAAVLGTSGSGKTTLLRVLAGFIRPSRGSVSFGERVVARAGTDAQDAFVPPEKRRVGIVPQEGALFPHLNVSANVGFGLPRGSRARIDEVLEMVDMSDYAQARPHDLSGGQQQRVALARALAPRPDIILFDEPFSALDAGMRTQLRAQVREVLRDQGTTAVLVTHDQDEALSTADLVAVMRHGRIVQTGTPREIYEAPIDLGVARFVGDAVELPATTDADGISCALGEIAVDDDDRSAMGSSIAGGAVVVLRPEQLVLSPCDRSGGVATRNGVVRDTAYFGHDSLLRVELADGTRIQVRVAGGTPLLKPGDPVRISVTGEGHLFQARPPDTG